MLPATITSVSEDDRNLVNFIATTVETVRDQVENMRVQLVTKDDLAAFKEQVAKKKDLASLKDDLARVESEMATKGDLAKLRNEMATRNDLSRLEPTMHGEFEQVHLRLDSIDRSLSNRTVRLNLMLAAYAASSTCSSKTNLTCCAFWSPYLVRVAAQVISNRSSFHG